MSPSFPLRRSLSVAASGILLMLLRAAPLTAQGVTKEGLAVGRTYGTSDTIVYTVGAFDFETSSSSVTWDTEAGTLDRYLTSNGSFYAAVHLPSGALVSGIEIQGCDNSSVGFLIAVLWSNTISGGVTKNATAHGSFGGDDTGTPGCDFYFSSFSPVTIDNHRRTYFVEVNTVAHDSSVKFSAVRLYYKLQVSPAPLAATFGDVPTNYIYFRAIEALAASGITSGCGGGNFCPNQAVTRGELAKFLANALGLHWPN